MATVAYDEKGIRSDDLLIRRISPMQVVPDGNGRGFRLSTQAFHKSSGINEGMSVDVEELIKAAGIEPKGFVTTAAHPYSACLTAGDVRGLGLQVGYDPVRNVPNVPDNPYHGQVWPMQPRRNFPRSLLKALASKASWYVEPPEDMEAQP